MQAEPYSNADHVPDIAAPSPSGGHTYGSTVVGGEARVQFGDIYTNLHIHLGGEHGQTSDPAPLTASAAVEGVRGANIRLVKIIRDVESYAKKSSPKYPENLQILKELKTELICIDVIFSGLTRFLRRTAAIPSGRTTLVPVQDVITVMTQLVLVYSEINTIVPQWQISEQFGQVGLLESIQRRPSRERSSRRRRDASGNDNMLATKRLLKQLQRHKLTLSLVLQIITWYGRLILT